MNRQIRQPAIGLMVCYVALFVTLNYWQVGRKQELEASFDNTRAIRREFDQPRGQILTANGTVIAQSVQNPPGSEFTYQRQYPTGDLYADISGYYTFAFGSTQLERTQNDVLAGATPEQKLRAIPGLLTGGGDNSGSVHTTIRDDLQQVAKDALGDREGSVVVMDPTTGAVKAMWSYPSYDPNLVVDPEFDYAKAVLTVLQASPGDPLLANAYQQRYMPGSTFKVLTTSIALQAGKVSLDSQFENSTEWVPPQTNDPIQNFGGERCGGDLTEVFTRSCNIPFAQLAVDVGWDAMLKGVADWGVGEPVPIDLPRPAASTFGSVVDPQQNLPLLAIRGFGQNEDQMVPLHMAMVASTVANGGKMMKPFVVQETVDHDGNVLDSTTPSVWKTPITPETATIMQNLMLSVAQRGTASCCIALANGIPVAAKTGTAQLNGPGQPERSNAWIVAYAPADAPRYAVAVMLKGTNAEISSSTGGRLAGPIAKTVLDQAFAGETGG
jgi:peptidoglycan glycosyltransferase